MRNRTRFGLGLGAGLATVSLIALIDEPAPPPSLPEYWSAPSFELVDQTGAPLTAADLRGSVWVAGFVFTSCADVCPGISARMARLTDDFRRERVLGDGVRLVSFTVDPERDTPAVLREYADGFGGLPPAEWAFVTGEPGDSVRALIERGFRLTAMRPPAAGDDAPADAHGVHATTDSGAVHGDADDYPVTHSPRVLLVDREGTVRGIYDGTDPDAMSAIVVDALALLGR